MTAAGLAVVIFLTLLAIVLGVFAWLLDLGSRLGDRDPS